ncbi:MAG TPA: PD-(D/E)XK nuclease family protein [Thermomonospora sp.]|nr:PD-(D/E)XK nuclease family protein [Thermomonospora sp.]
MPERLYSCTPSRLNTWLDCPRRYRMTYLDRPAPPKGPPWAHNSLGASVHNALAAWWRLPPPERTPAAAGSLLLRGWITEGYRDEEQSAAWRERARAMVEEYASRLDPADEPLGVERTVAAKTARIALQGRIDRLDSRDGALVVVDYKTGRRTPSPDDARGSLALALYAVAASRVLRRPCRRVELHHLPTGTVAAWEHTDESLGRHLDRAETIAGETSQADEAYRTRLRPTVPRPREGDAGTVDHTPFDTVFPPRPGPLCSWCDYNRHCPEGREAAPRKEPWAALGDA